MILDPTLECLRPHLNTLRRKASDLRPSDAMSAFTLFLVLRLSCRLEVVLNRLKITSNHLTQYKLH